MGIQTFPIPDASGGGGYNFQLITSIDLSVGTPSSVTFSAIDPKYRALKLVYVATATTLNTRLQLNGDTGTKYRSVHRRLENSSWSTSNSTVTTFIQLDHGGGTSGFGSFIIENTNIAVAKSVSGAGGGSAFKTAQLITGGFDEPAVTTSLTLLSATSNFTGGTAYLLGSE